MGSRVWGGVVVHECDRVASDGESDLYVESVITLKALDGSRGQ